ncbi:hypothetical protein D9M71_469440 [compost metagenome]
MLVQGFLLGQVALDQHPLAPVAVQAIEHVLHLLARGEQHQAAAGIFDDVRQFADDRCSMRRRIPRVGLEVGDPKQAGIAMHERAGHHAGDCVARQPRTHAETVALAQRGQCRRGHQRAVGHAPQATPQHIGGEDGAGVDFDVEQRATFGQRQPARHGRAVFRVFGGEGRPQLPVTLGTGDQAAEQRIPLFGLVAGDADIDLAVHAFLEQVSQAGEQIVEAGKALFQFDAHFTNLLRHHPTLETVTRALAAFGVLAGTEVSHLFTKGEHELLLGAYFSRQLRHLLDVLAQIAGQRMLGQQFGQVLGGLFQPVGGGTQPRIMGEMADGLVWQMMAFVEHVHGIARVG